MSLLTCRAPGTNVRASLISTEGAFSLDALMQNGLSIPYARECLTLFSRLGCEYYIFCKSVHFFTICLYFPA